MGSSVLAGPALAADWPQFRGPGRDGRTVELVDFDAWGESGPTELWRVDLGDGYSSVVVAGGRAFAQFGSQGEERLAAFEAATGKELWTTRLDRNRPDSEGGAGPRATPSVVGDLAYALSAFGKLTAVEVASGKARWQVDLVRDLGASGPRWGFSTSPLVDGPLVLVAAGGSQRRSLAAFDKETGELRWTTESGPPGYSSPILVTVAGVRQAVFFTRTELVGVAIVDGRRLWRLPFRREHRINATSPIFLPPDRLFLSSSGEEGAIAVRLVRNGDSFDLYESWRNRELVSELNSAVLVGGHLYGYHDTILKCLDAATGEERWKARHLSKGSLLAVGDRLLVLGDSGWLSWIDASPEGLNELGRSRPLKGRTWTPPSLSDGRLFVRSRKELVALDLGVVAPASAAN